MSPSRRLVGDRCDECAMTSGPMDIGIFINVGETHLQTL